MYIVPHTEKRVVVKQDRAATINATRTAWGKRRAENFFAKFLQENKSPWICHVSHPIASWRYAGIQFTNRELSLEQADILSNCPLNPLTNDELEYIRLSRQLDFTNGSVLRALEQVESRLKDARTVDHVLGSLA